MAAMGDPPRTCVLVLGGPWEATALPALGAAGVVVVKRCVDLADLLASARLGQADIAVVAASAPGLDADAVMQLLRDDVRVVAVEEAGTRSTAERMARIGVIATTPGEPDAIVAAVQAAVRERLVVDPEPVPDVLAPAPSAYGRTLAVWGPTGGPGRTTVAIGLAAQRALREPTILVDADPYGGAVAQHLGVLDEVSGMLGAARLVNTGALDAASLARTRRRLGERLEVLTGLPRADRWVEVRPGVVPAVLAQAAAAGDVVVDCGFCLEEDLDGRSGGRNQMTLDALASADEVVVVGSAEPTGLARLARGLVELAEVVPGLPVRVVVNRMRDTLGWSRRDIAGMVEGYVRPVGIHFLPEDRSAVDRSLVAGRTLVEAGESSLGKAFAELAASAYAEAQAPKSR